jgi:hypothetical protein
MSISTALMLTSTALMLIGTALMLVGTRAVLVSIALMLVSITLVLVGMRVMSVAVVFRLGGESPVFRGIRGGTGILRGINVGLQVEATGGKGKTC